MLQQPPDESPRFIGNSVASFDSGCKGAEVATHKIRHMSALAFTNNKQPMFSCMDFYE